MQTSLLFFHLKLLSSQEPTTARHDPAFAPAPAHFARAHRCHPPSHRPPWRPRRVRLQRRDGLLGRRLRCGQVASEAPRDRSGVSRGRLDQDRSCPPVPPGVAKTNANMTALFQCFWSHLVQLCGDSCGNLPVVRNPLKENRPQPNGVGCFPILKIYYIKYGTQ